MQRYFDALSFTIASDRSTNRRGNGEHEHMIKSCESPRDKTLVSLVIACYRSEKTVRTVIDEIEQVFSTTNQYDYELFLVNDCSPDNVWPILKDAADQNERVTAVSLAKNMGRLPALMAGFRMSKGEIVVILDDDGQCPMDRVFDLIAPISGPSNFDVATAAYPVKKQSWFKNFGSKVNEHMTNVILDKPKEIRFNNFTAMRRFVIDEILRYENPYPYLTGLLLRTTHRIACVPMEERERLQGKTTYTFKKLITLWMNGFTAFSVKPLRMATVVGFATAIVGFLWSIFIVIQKIVNPGEILAGYSSLMAVLLLIGGMIMLMLGLIGEYIGRIYISINRSPQYVVREVYCGKLPALDGENV
jgi:polyisoprenyl-phosphate glycosyltransferase